jgi:lipopolysaccharide/colanic/teichoic acid biosynthesis glycosyltransferase
MKRTFDVLMAAVILVIVFPILVTIAIAIWAESKGPILFRQTRFGLRASHFDVLKFRTMYADRGDLTGKLSTKPRDDRVTRVGRVLRRTSLDELPQLLNVIRGEMSLVGPRPHPLHMQVEGVLYDSAVTNYHDRHLVKPGITGWAQVNGSRGEVRNFEDAWRRMEFDLEYIQRCSFWLDMRIVVRTALGGFITNAD